MLLEVEKGLKPVALDRVFRERGLFESKPSDLVLKIVVLLAGVAQIDVVGPAVANVVPETVEKPLERRNGQRRPNSGSA